MSRRFLCCRGEGSRGIHRIRRDAALCLLIQGTDEMEAPVESRRILIIDDEKDVLDLLDTFLRTIHFEPLTTSRWTEAIDLITHKSPCLILLDLHLPTIQGETLLEFIRSQGSKIPVIVVSAYLNKEKEDELRRLGADEFVAKPFSLADLHASINRVLESSAGQVTASQETRTPPIAATEPARPRATVPIPPPESQGASALAQQEGSRASSSEPDVRRHGRHSHHRRRRPRNAKIYIAVTLACLLGSLAFALIGKLPSLMSGSLQKAVQKSLESEISRERKAVENMSDSEKEALRRAVGK